MLVSLQGCSRLRCSVSRCICRGRKWYAERIATARLSVPTSIASRNVELWDRARPKQLEAIEDRNEKEDQRCEGSRSTLSRLSRYEKTVASRDIRGGTEISARHSNVLRGAGFETRGQAKNSFSHFGRAISVH